jgi:hypothetical protein
MENSSDRAVIFIMLSAFSNIVFQFRTKWINSTLMFDHFVTCKLLLVFVDFNGFGVNMLTSRI